MESVEGENGLSRRTVVRAGANLAWMVPAIALVTEAPALAVSAAPSLAWVGASAGAWAGASNVSLLGLALYSQKTAPFNVTTVALKNTSATDSVIAGSLKITVTLSAFTWFTVSGLSLLTGSENFNTPTIAAPWTVSATPISGQTGSLQFVFTYANAVAPGATVTMPNLAFSPSGPNLVALLSNPKESANVAVSQASNGTTSFTLPAPQTVTSTN